MVGTGEEDKEEVLTEGVVSRGQEGFDGEGGDIEDREEGLTEGEVSRG